MGIPILIPAPRAVFEKSRHHRQPHYQGRPSLVTAHRSGGHSCPPPQQAPASPNPKGIASQSRHTGTDIFPVTSSRQSGTGILPVTSMPMSQFRCHSNPPPPFSPPRQQRPSRPCPPHQPPPIPKGLRPKQAKWHRHLACDLKANVSISLPQQSTPPFSPRSISPALVLRTSVPQSQPDCLPSRHTGTGILPVTSMPMPQFRCLSNPLPPLPTPRQQRPSRPCPPYQPPPTPKGLRP
jgi:hypothetical protein